MKEIKVLISPAHYLFSDKYGSEPGYSYSITKYLASHVGRLDVIVGVADISEPLPKNVNLIPIYKSRGNHPLVGFIKYMMFYPLLCMKFAFQFQKYDLVHHMFPTSPHTVDPLIILIKMFSPSTKVVIGPLQLESQLNSPQDLSIMLIGKPNVSIVSSLLQIAFKVLLKITDPLSQLTFKMADVIVCNFHVIKRFYIDFFPSEKIVVIPTGVDPFRRAIPVASVKKHPVTIISAGRLMPHKGHQYLLEAFKLLVKERPQVRLVILGSGGMQSDYEKFTKESGIADKVVFTGHVLREQVNSWYAKSDIFCLPSLVDTNPVVVIEAMSYGLPVVATNVGAVEEIVDKSGIVVEKENAHELFKALKKLVDNPSIRATMGKIGMERAGRQYNWKIIASQWFNLYSQLVAK